MDIVGGDTSSSYTGLTISITCIGEGEKGKVVYRNGAKETDLICVSGDLGAAYMGLQLLEREKSVLKGGDKDLQPDFAGKEYLLERQLKPEARRDIIQKLAKEGIQPTSMMYSQVELRVLAHISQDENMIHAFNHGEDIHKQAASKVLGIPIEEVTKEQRSSAKAVNFGIVYGISDFGLANQLGVSNKQAKEYINQYLEKYQGIKHFMNDIVESAKAKGYVETLFGRRRYIPEIKSSNYMVRQFGSRVAMNTPIQGTAADIMKIAMINVNKTLKEKNINGKIVLQIHDELLLEVSKEDKQQAKEILKQCMENAMKLSVPLEVEISEGEDWYEVK